MDIWNKLDLDERKEILRIYKSNLSDSNKVGTVMELIFGKDNFTPKTYGQAELFAEHPELKEQYERLSEVSYTMGAGRKICCYWLLSFIREYGYEEYNPNEKRYFCGFNESNHLFVNVYRETDFHHGHYIEEPVLIFSDYDEANRFLESNTELIRNYLNTKNV